MAQKDIAGLKRFFKTPDANATSKESQIKLSKGQYDDLCESVLNLTDGGTTAGIINSSVTVSNATSADIDLTSIASDHKLYLTGAFAADVILPQATAANVGMRIDVFCTTATAASGTIRIGFTNAGSTVMTGGITLVSTGAKMDSIGIHTAVNNSKVLLLDSDNAALCGGLEGSRYSFFYQVANAVFVEAIGHTSAATPALSSATSATGIS